MGMDTQSGELTPLLPNDPRITNPPPNMVILHGKQEDIEKVAEVYKRDLKAKAKRKAQRQARKKNR